MDFAIVYYYYSYFKKRLQKNKLNFKFCTKFHDNQKHHKTPKKKKSPSKIKIFLNFLKKYFFYYKTPTQKDASKH